MKNYKLIFGPVKQRLSWWRRRPLSFRMVWLWCAETPNILSDWALSFGDVLNIVLGNGKLVISWSHLTEMRARLVVGEEDRVNEWVIGIAPEIIDIKPRVQGTTP